VTAGLIIAAIAVPVAWASGLLKPPRDTTYDKAGMDRPADRSPILS
jgi:hypothetical protein